MRVGEFGRKRGRRSVLVKLAEFSEGVAGLGGLEELRLAVVVGAVARDGQGRKVVLGGYLGKRLSVTETRCGRHEAKAVDILRGNGRGIVLAGGQEAL